MNLTFEEQVKNQVQYPIYTDIKTEPNEDQKKLIETKKKLNDMESIISDMKKDLIKSKIESDNVQTYTIKKLRKLIVTSNNYSSREFSTGYGTKNNQEKFNCLLKIVEQQNKRIAFLEKSIKKN